MVSFFDRNRKELEKRGIDPARLPPGQYHTDRFPVLHVGSVPDYGDLSGWDLRIDGLVATPVTLSWSQLLELPTVEIVTDIHCVTKWSKFDTGWKGVAFDTIAALVDIEPSATHLMCHSEFGYTANLPLVDVTGLDDAGRPKAMLAYEYDGKPLEAEHGYPLRFLCPHLYFWKSAKWLRGIELMKADRPGFWEQNGYHIYGDPFLEQRYS
jgi:DMSO/TMAO reductase YedYZ molybdopterin-dependent catalytic subunit